MPYQTIMKFSGASASGKTTAAKFLSQLLYGQEELGHVSSAAAYSLASQNPLVILDNLEENDRNKSLKMFLFLCATGGSKEKRAGGTDSDTVQEKPKSLVLITAIEPLEEPELINRTIDIEFSKAHRSDDFVESSVLREIGKRREVIVSAILKLIQKDILPNLEAGIKKYLLILKTSHKDHSKDRADEYIALLMLILEKILPHMPLKGEDDFTNNPAEIWTEWLKYQNRQAEDDETQGNSILRMLDGLAAEYEVHMRDKDYVMSSDMPGFKDIKNCFVFKYHSPHYMLDAEKTQPELIEVDNSGEPCEPYHRSQMIFTAPSNQLVAAMSTWCKDKGFRNPYESASRFTKRLTNDEPTLARGGWKLLRDPNLTGPYSRILQGTRLITLVKTMER
jgi:DNA primase